MANYSFDRLSIQDQSDLIREFIKAGIYDLNQMKDHYEKSEFELDHPYVFGGYLPKLYIEGGGINTKKSAVNTQEIKPLVIQNYDYLIHPDYNQQIMNEAAVLSKMSDNIMPVSNRQKTIDKKMNDAYTLTTKKTLKTIIPRNFNSEDKDDDRKVHMVKSGDTLWDIAKKNKMSLGDLATYNPHIKDINKIQIGDSIYLEPEKPKKEWVDINELYGKEDSYNSLESILNAPHNGNYAILDKNKGWLWAYDRNNNVLDSMRISSGLSGNDYNTAMVFRDGKVQYGEGNMSTPAGIYKITGQGTYHGVPSFTRGRINNRTKSYEDIASSIHEGKTVELYTSNGCVRMEGKDLKRLKELLPVGSMTYTLPSDDKVARFQLVDNQLTFTARNPNGINTGPQRYWDDYNQHLNTDYNPIRISYNPDSMPNNIFKVGETKQQQDYIQAIVDGKQRMQKDFGISSKDYNKIAKLALGIVHQESEFGTGYKYIAKNGTAAGRTAVDIGHAISDGYAGSRGPTQIKFNDDIKNKDYARRYAKYGIREGSQLAKNYTDAAVATMVRLLSMYRDELGNGKKVYYDKYGDPIDPTDALLYLWQGKKGMLIKGEAYPKGRDYVQKVKKYANNYKIETYINK